MIVKQIVTKKSVEISEISCDVCGKSCEVYRHVIDNDLRPDNSEVALEFEYMQLSANWGYFSKKDTQTWTAQICESCVDKHLGFIKFNKKNYL